MKTLIACITNPDLGITSGNHYEVKKEIVSNEIGLMYQITNDTGKLANLRALNFEAYQPEIGSDIGKYKIMRDFHERGVIDNRERLEIELNELLMCIREPDIRLRPVNHQDVKQFIEKLEGYLLAIMFHSASLRQVID